MKTSILIKLFVIVGMLVGFSSHILAQEEEAPKKDTRPVKNTFESGVLLNNQTVMVPIKNTLEMMMQHRFGKLNSEDFDLLGLYAPSNIRIGFTYTIIDNFQIGIGTTKNKKLQDFNYKYAILKQTRSGSIPLSITYYGNTSVDLRKDVFPKFTNRLSYFNQLIIARKINDRISLELSPSFSHFNMVDSSVKHNNIGLSFNGRVKVNDAMGVIFEYDQNFTKQDEKIITVKPNASLGLEASTGSHAFQIFVGTNDNIMAQHNYLYNANDFTKKEILLGFNITRLWNY